MTAVDVVQPGTAGPNPTLREQVIQAAFRRGLLLLGCGESALRFCPPLCVTAAQVDTALRVLDEVIGSLRSPAGAAAPIASR